MQNRLVFGSGVVRRLLLRKRTFFRGAKDDSPVKRPHYLVFASLAFSTWFLTSGCNSSPSASREPISWIEEGIQSDKVNIALGYRSGNIDQSIEPIAAITQNNSPVAGAMVFCRLVSTDGAESFGEEVATRYAPALENEPAYYGQATLELPKQSSPCAIRFRIVLPGDDQDWTRDMKVRR